MKTRRNGALVNGPRQISFQFSLWPVNHAGRQRLLHHRHFLSGAVVPQILLAQVVPQLAANAC